MNFILEHILEIGLDAGKDKIKGTHMETEARKRLEKFLEGQQKLNFNCTMEEEIDFASLADYIRHDLINDVKKRLFGDKKTRGIAHKTIIEKAAYYARSKTKISEQRAKKIVSTAMDILRKYYESKANCELSYYAGRIEDTLTDEISNKCTIIFKEVKGVKDQIESTKLLSLDENMKLARNGQIDKVGDNLSDVIKAVSTTHPLYPYYGYKITNPDGEFVSIALCKEAAIKYPPQFNIIANNVHVGSKHICELQGYDVLEYSYRHQLPISLDVTIARKILGNIDDPAQAEAKKLQGSKMILTPPEFPEAFPCSISMNGEMVFDYLLMRTKEILEDGTILVTNEEQGNRGFDIVFSINQINKEISFKIHPLTASNTEQLRYREFIRNASKGGTIAIKVLSLNTLLGTANIEPFIPSERLDLEIEFLKKITVIENYFNINLVVPQEITIEDHQIIDHVYKMIDLGHFSGHWSTFSSKLEISEDFRRKIAKLDDTLYKFVCVCVSNFELFNQKFSFSMRREFRAARFKDLKRIKEKAKILDIGDTITIHFIPGGTDENNTYIDTFARNDEIQSE